MKILIDPIYTNDQPLCSWNYKMKVLVEYLVSKRDDVYFYWAVPQDIHPKAARLTWTPDWLPHFGTRVLPLPVGTYKDRMRCYFHFPRELERAMFFCGTHWDWDMAITGRVHQTPNMKVMGTGPRDFPCNVRSVVTVEDMPIMSFKECVYQTMPQFQDLQALTGYAAADANYFMSFWEKDAMLRVARAQLAPSRVMDLSKKSFDASPVQIFDINVKPVSKVASIDARRETFTVGYTQRFEVIHRGSADIMDAFEKQWVMKHGKEDVEFVAMSNTRTTGKVKVDEDVVKVKRLPREEFWEAMNSVAVIVVMSIDDAYPLSLIEPLVKGVPVILLKAQYALHTVGPEYPFFVDNITQAYALLDVFMKEYATCYAKFAEWQEKHYLPMLKKRNEVWLPILIEKEIQRLEGQFMQVRTPTDVSVMLDEIAEDGQINVIEGLKVLEKQKKIRAIGYMTKPDFGDGMNATFLTPINRFRRDLQINFGYTDFGAEVGGLRKP